MLFLIFGKERFSVLVFSQNEKIIVSIRMFNIINYIFAQVIF